MTTDLTILCITNFGQHTQPFITRMEQDAETLGAKLVLGADSPKPSWLTDAWHVIDLNSDGYIESVLDQAIAACPDGYVLRLDDDEQIGPAMLDWLKAGEHLTAPHWAFPRMHLYPDAEHYIKNAPLWPDLQTRLSLKALAGGRTRVHQGSPHGTGHIAPVAIEHHKFLARPLWEREALLERYERLQPGAGSQFYAFSVPERWDWQCALIPVDR